MNNRFIEGSPEHNLDNNQKQADADGTIVIVSRQALHEVLDKLYSLPTTMTLEQTELKPIRSDRKLSSSQIGEAPATTRKCPWPDFKGNDIHEGDTLEHPSGQFGTVIFVNHSPYPNDNWLVDYPNGGRSRLCLQIGYKGRGIVNSKPSCFGKKLGIEACDDTCPVVDECYKTGENE